MSWTREQIEEELFKDECARSYPTVDRDQAARYVRECKPIAERLYSMIDPRGEYATVCEKDPARTRWTREWKNVTCTACQKSAPRQ